MKYLVIVESPSKCKKIEKYLNDNDRYNIYEVVATMGHITELKSLNNIDIHNNYLCTYEIIEAKKKHIELIKKKAKQADEVLLFLDRDREGEGIAYMVCNILKLDVNKTKRILFNEITETAIVKALHSPKTIDTNLVNAQQTRQILDLLVGFKITPMLWKYITRKTKSPLSAGRCQIPALKLIYDNQNEINENENQSNLFGCAVGDSVNKQKTLSEIPVYNTVGYFTNHNIPFELNKQFVMNNKNEQLVNFLKETMFHTHEYSCSLPVVSYKEPPSPFITSTLQQSASNLLHFSPKETMQLCQKLYEEGYITYMRTDSKTYSDDFINKVKSYILNKYDKNYINDALRKNSNNTEAHEAIRPTDINISELPLKIGLKENKLYKLIWTNTLESCMSNACINTVIASISAVNSNVFTYKSEIVHFLGWKTVKQTTENDKYYHYLQSIKKNTILKYKKIQSTVVITGVKLHYTEARLIQLLEEKGIGRPSTFSSIVEKIQEREYVKKEDIKAKKITCKEYELDENLLEECQLEKEYGAEKNKLIIQPLGINVVNFLNNYFDELFHYDFTKELEIELDKIAKNEMNWIDLCNKCNNQIDKSIKNIPTNNECQYIKIDDNNTYMVSKYGPVIKNITETNEGHQITSFTPVCKEIDVNKEKCEYTIEELLQRKTDNKKISQIILGKQDNNDIVLKKGKYGLYVKWGEKQINLKELGNRPIENIRLEDVEKYLNNSNIIRVISKDMSIRKGPSGDYLFYKTIKMKKPKFYDIKKFIIEIKENYKKCDISLLKDWIKNEYGITT
jgi:DNA topoisomerase-1